MKSTFPRRASNEKNIQEARKRERELKNRHNEKINSYKYRID